MKKYILDYINKLEGGKTNIKQLHWNAKNLPQHQLCDDIAEKIAEHQDKISEVEQSISGKFKIGELKGTTAPTSSLMGFIKAIISDAKDFYAKLQNEGDEYIGMRSDVESFLSDMQRFKYLADFTVKESLKERLRDKITENRVEITDGNEIYSLTENELRELIRESIDKVMWLNKY